MKITSNERFITKKLLVAIATIGLTLSLFGQGAVAIDTWSSAGGVKLEIPGMYYTGPFGLELWMKNGSAADPAINSLNGSINENMGLAYYLLTADGFTLQTRINGLTLTVPGVLEGIGVVNMPGVDRAANGGNAVLGLVIWPGWAPNFGSASTAGILTFVNPTSDYTIPPPNTPIPPPLDGFNTDLIIANTPGPEPGVFALAGLGAAVLLVFRSRLGCR